MDVFLRAHLKTALPGVAIDWGMNAQGMTLPRVTLTRISGGPDYTMTGPSGLAQARVQIDCFAVTVAEAKLLAANARRALGGLRAHPIAGAFLDQERDLPPDTEGGGITARVSLDFIIHYQED